MDMRITKRIIFFFLFSSYFVCVSQNGSAFYKKILINDSNDETNESDYMRQAINQLKNREYILSFNKNYAVYNKVKELDANPNPLIEAFTQGISGFNGEVYFDKSINLVLHKKEILGSVFLVKNNDLKWTLTNETLTVDNFICYKATTIKTIENSVGKHELVAYAWYCPEIPLPFGPDGFGGLPGLIMQLEYNGVITVLKKIEFYEEGNNIVLPKKGEEMEEDEFNDFITESYNNRKKSSNRN